MVCDDKVSAALTGMDAPKLVDIGYNDPEVVRPMVWEKMARQQQCARRDMCHRMDDEAAGKARHRTRTSSSCSSICSYTSCCCCCERASLLLLL